MTNIFYSFPYVGSPDSSLRSALESKIENLTKPKGSLGMLENIALQIGLVQQTLSPVLTKPVNIVFAATHGIANEKVSKTPQEVNEQVVYNMINGGAGICFLCKQHGIELKVVDAGVDADFPENMPIIHNKIRKGTRNYHKEAALTQSEVAQALEKGREICEQCFTNGTNIVSFGEMGVGNTATSAVWMHLLTGIDIKECVGAGSGLDEEGVRLKTEILAEAVSKYKGSADPWQVMTYFGGLEMVMTVGAMIQAAHRKMIIVVDGFIMTACVLLASRLTPNLIDYCIFGHCADEAGHKKLLKHLDVKALLHLGLRLGEGSGAVAAYPLIDSAVRMINEMHTFEGAKVTKYI